MGMSLLVVLHPCVQDPLVTWLEDGCSPGGLEAGWNWTTFRCLIPSGNQHVSVTSMGVQVLAVMDDKVFCPQCWSFGYSSNGHIIFPKPGYLPPWGGHSLMLGP